MVEEPQVLDEWRKLSTLGSGGFGVVSLWRNERTCETLAIKKCRWERRSQMSEKQRQRWMMEVDFMKNMKHENIVAYKSLPERFLKLLENYNPSALPLLPMEYCSKGNLRHCLTQPENSCGLPETEVRSILADLSAAISHLHTCNITHRDIKPENVVLQVCPPRPSGIIYKLIDLGYAKDMNALVSFVGTVAYLAPEIFQNQNYSHNVDYWSFGTLAYEIVCNKHPFLPKATPVERFKWTERKEPEHICVYQSQSGKVVYTDEILSPHWIPLWLKTHLEKWLRLMLRYEPESRGKSPDNEDVFKLLDRILNIKVLKLFCVHTYQYYHYELTDDLSFAKLRTFIERDTGISKDQQILLTENGLYPTESFVLKIRESKCVTSELILFKRNEYVKPTKIQLPSAVCNVLKKDIKHQYRWDELYALMSLCVHFVGSEQEKMAKLRKSVVGVHFDYVRQCHQDQIAAFNRLRNIGADALKEMDAFIERHLIKNNKLRNDQDFVKKFRRNLWRAKELIENTNAAAVRIHKLRNKDRLLQISHERVRQLLHDDLKLDDLCREALECLNITKHKPEMTSCAITKVICTCLKYRDNLQNHETLHEHFHLTYKMLREMDKLKKWINCLTIQLEKFRVDLADQKPLDEHKNSESSFASNDLDGFFNVLRDLHWKYLESLRELDDFVEFCAAVRRSD